MRCCFLFGHSDCPDNIIPILIDRIDTFHVEHGIDVFYVGDHGSFDRAAITAIRDAKKRYPQIQAYLLLSYHPAERPVELSEGFDGSFYPPLEGVPRRYAILRANRYMLAHADGIICYVNHVGNSRDLLELARQRQRRDGIPVENLGTYCPDGIKM